MHRRWKLKTLLIEILIYEKSANSLIPTPKKESENFKN